MQGMILAAGMGKRLKSLTNNNTKCMVKVNGITLIERTLRILDKKNLSKIVIVVGYCGQNLIDFIETLNISTPIIYIDNPVFDKTNNIYSLALAKSYLCLEDTLLLESDLIFEESAIDLLIADDRPNLALVDKFKSWMDGTCLRLNEDDSIKDFISGKHVKFSETEDYFKTVNIYKFSKSFSQNIYVPFLTAYESAMGENEYYETVLKLIAVLETKEILAKRLDGQVWYEIDNIQDLDIAESLFPADFNEQYRMIASRYGGFWRYPKLLDFCYLVNPYYPPEKLREEMHSNFDILLTQYPSGMNVNSLLVSGVFGVRQNSIIVGNGAAELIKALMENILDKDAGNLGCVYPTFEEYPNRFDKTRITSFRPEGEDLRYTVDDLIRFFGGTGITTLLLINPDNPSGNYISFADTLRLIDWCKANGIALIVDESFVDFSDAASEGLSNVSLLSDDVLSRYSNLYVVKSISKSYGVPGARLGVLASSDFELISKIKKDVAIWNINSFGEFFLQIMEKYNKDYLRSLEKVRKSRKVFLNRLSALPYLTVYPSQANYVMCRLTGITSAELCSYLLGENILIKDLTSKISNGQQYIRLAVRSDEDNEKLIRALEKFSL